MNRLIRRCASCKSYTLQKACPRCGGETVSPHPAKFSLMDKYARYRIPSRYIADNAISGEEAVQK